VVSDGITTTVVGSLSSTANKTFTVEFFASDSSSPGGEGEVYMGSAVVTTDGAGNADFTATLSVGVTAGAIITATATNDAGSTSQFSGTVAATGPAIDNAPVANDDAYTVAQDSTLNVDWWDTAWTKRQKLTFDNLRQSEHLYDFPVLVKLTGGYNIDYSQTQANGEDLRFFDADGTALAYEIEEWDENGTSYVWVRVPKVDGWSNTDHIWMYYGNGTAIAGQSAQDVWLPSYQGVWHLGESGTGAVDEFKDSTAFANHGQGGDGSVDATITPTQNTGGKIGNAQMFDGNDYIEVTTDFSLTNASMELWFYYDPADALDRILIGKSPGGTSESWHIQDNNGVDIRIRDDIDSAGAPKYDTAIGGVGWHHAVATMEGLENKLYLDGVLIGSGLSSTDNLASFAGSLFIGQRGNDSMYWDNLIDEVRVSDVSRSADWVAAQYASMSGTFVNFSGVQSAPALSGVIANDTDDDDDPLNAVLIDGPSKAASFTFNADGTFSYTPTAGYAGADSFTYLVNDVVGGGDSNIATVNINVTGPNTAPVAVDDNYTINEGDTLSTAAGWWDSNWSYRQDITIDNSSNGVLTDFALRVHLDASFDYSLAKADGSDLRFLDDDGTTELSYDIESWNPGGDSYIWVKVPTVNGGTTDTISLYYGNGGAATPGTSADVWSNGYSAVYHFGTDPGASGPVPDSSGNGLDGTNNNSVFVPNEIIGGAQDFDGSLTQYVTMPAGDYVNGAAQATVSAWINPDTLSGTQHIAGVTESSGPGSSRFALELVGSDIKLIGKPDDASGSISRTTTVASGLTVGSWYRIDAVADFAGDSISIYVNGNHLETFNSVLFPQGAVDPTNSAAAAIGIDEALGGIPYQGMIDEVSFSKVARTADEIAAHYANITGAYATIGAVQEIAILENDTDVDADPLTVSEVDGSPANVGVPVITAQGGTVTVLADGSFTYTPLPAFSGIDTFTYKANDGAVDSGLATVTINVVNTAPIANDDTYSVNQGGTLDTTSNWWDSNWEFRQELTIDNST
jgi:hypothetical protein